ncbi:MAG: dihydropyrimidinase [Spirochaetales bacterium]|jgi:dihydropyrimidinase|nr:dihydropyrimidinase [Spirochaetales bacterium]
MFDLIIKNGTVITPKESFKADLAVTGGKIACLGQGLEGAKEVYDAEGKFILPGGIDVHTHLAMPFGGTVSSDDYFTGTRAAACGGVTTVFDYVIQRKGQGLVEAADLRLKMAEPEACVDFAFHVAITDLNDKILNEITSCIAYGIPSFKVFTVYKKEGMMVDDGVLVKLLEKSAQVGALINVHAENPDVIDMRIEQFLKEGKTSAWYHYLSRPEFVEAEADKRVIHWAKSLNAPLYIVHLANKEGMEEVIRAKDEGYPIYAETCPQYLAFTCDVYKREDGRNFVCSPPMKGQESQDALWQGIRSGDIDTVATDHCPFTSAEKDWGKDNFTKIPNGCMGIENLYPYLLDAAGKGRLSYNRAVELVSANPAKLFGLAGRKGSLQPGFDADVVVYDPKKDFTIKQTTMHSATDYTIWEGTQLKGYPVRTYSRGSLVYKDGEFLGQKGYGKYLKRNPRS